MEKWLDRMERLIERMPKGKLLVQFIKFGIVGIINTVVSLVITYFIMGIFRLGFHINATWSLNIATTGGYVAGVCNSYYWNNKYVFKNKRETNGRKVFAKVFICYGVTYLLSMLIMDVLVEVYHMPAMIAPIPRLIITIPLNFCANKLWAFRDK